MLIAGQLTDLDWSRIQDILAYKIDDNEEMLHDKWYDEPDMADEKRELEEDIAHYHRIYEMISEFQAQAKRGAV